MKKVYSKPDISFMELRLEEKIAGFCTWKSGFLDGVQCNEDHYQDAPEPWKTNCIISALAESTS